MNPPLNFAANLSWLYTDLPFLDRFEAAARDGFKAVECLFPHEHADNEVAARLRGHDLRLVLFNAEPGDWVQGERGLACLPGREDAFRRTIAEALTRADRLGCPQIHVMAGLCPHDERTRHRAAMQRYESRLAWAAGEARAEGKTLLIEPINTFDVPGFWLNRTQLAIDVLDEVASDGKTDNAFVQYDIYHAQRYEGELAATMTKHLARIGHIQVADNPGRNEPGTGEINFGFLFRHLDRIGYSGWIGAEYKPAGNTEAGLAWMTQPAGAVAVGQEGGREGG